MTRVTLTRGDVVSGVTIRKGEGVEVGPLPKGIGLERLRVDAAGALVDLGELSQVWVGPDGLLHCYDVGHCQLVSMTWGQRRRLVCDQGEWRVMSDEEVLEAVKAEVRSAIDRMRDRLIARNLTYTFPDTGEAGTVQVRTMTDRSNLQGLGSQALLLKVSGDTTTTLPFRDGEDVDHSLTADEMIAMTTQALSWVQAHYTTSWAHKDAVGKAAGEGLSDVASVRAYDYSTGWPE